jgi:hypothetical protein
MIEDFEKVRLGVIRRDETLKTEFLEIYAGSAAAGEINTDSSQGHVLQVLVGGQGGAGGGTENFPKVTFIKETSAVSFKAYLLVGKFDFHAADGSLLGSVSPQPGSWQPVSFSPTGGRKIKYVQAGYAGAGWYSMALDDFEMDD